MQAPYYHNYVGDTEQYVQNTSASSAPTPKKTRVVVSSKEVLGDNVDLKKMLGILIILMIVVFFTILISIVVTLMKPGCKCNTGAFFPPQPYYGPPPGSVMNNLPFV